MATPVAKAVGFGAAISSALTAIVTFFTMLDQFTQAGEKIARYTNDSAEHFTEKSKLQRFAELRDIREQLKVLESDVPRSS